MRFFQSRIMISSILILGTGLIVVPVEKLAAQPAPPPDPSYQSFLGVWEAPR